MNDFVSIGIGIAIVTYMSVGIVEVHFSDDRPFKEIKEQCEKNHHIQDKTTRIKCEVEKE